MNAIGSLEELRHAVHAVSSVRSSISHAFIVSLDANKRPVAIRAVMDHSAVSYRDAEREKGRNAVLVDLDRAQDLQAAYPNYFLDVGDFTALARDVIRPPVPLPIAVQTARDEGLMRFLRRNPTPR